MFRKSKILSVALCLIIFALPSFASEPLKIGTQAPQFELLDLDGNVVKLSDFKGKYVVIEWTNPNCPFVVRHYTKEKLGDFQRECAEKGIVWLAINSTNKEHKDYESPEELKDIFAKWDSGYHAQLMDSDGIVGKQYDAKTTPHMYIIDKKGNLLYNGGIDDDPRGNKEKRLEYVSLALNEILAGKEVTTSTSTPYGCSVKY